MAKENLENLSTESLKKRLLYANLIALVIGIAAITVTLLYFLIKEKNTDLLIVGAGLGVALSSYQRSVANKIKKEIKRREDK
jgi:hypothetical protein